MLLVYVTVGIDGLTEVELEDVLSCDNDVLNEVYVYHDPPVPGVLRIPNLLWTRLKLEISEYLTERLSYGRVTKYWYHRQFIEAAQARYSGPDVSCVLHTNLLEIFTAVSGIRKDIHLTKRKLDLKDVDRQVVNQKVTTRNKRALRATLHHFDSNSIL